MYSILKDLRGIENVKPLSIVSAGHGVTHWVNGIFIVLLPFIAQDLSLTYTTTGSMVTVFFIAAVAITIISGPVIDISKKYILAQFLCLISGALALLLMSGATSTLILATAAVFIGVCVSGWHTPSIPYLSHLYNKNRGLALSIHTVGASLGDGIAPPIAGLIMLVLSWQQTSLLLSIPVAFMSFYVLRSLPQIRADQNTEDNSSGKYNYWEGLKGLLSNRDMLVLCILAGLWSMTQNGLVVFLPLYLVGEMQSSPVLVGFALFSIQLGAVFGGPIVGTLSDRVGRRPVVIYSLIISAILLIIIPLLENIYLFILMSSLAGCSLYSIRPVIHSWTMDISAGQTSGSAISMLFTAQAALTGLIPIIGGLTADIFGLKLVFVLLTLTSMLALILSFLMPKRAI
tara:strand:- start:1240 stop:2442 length:1203 start_codon:yes stop_codon:yes gene_type:complete